MSRRIHNNTKRALIGMVVILWHLGCGYEPEITELPPGALIVDVRTPKEFKADHYPGAVNIPLNRIEKRVSEFGEQDRPIVVYCRSGNRSERAKSLLTGIGFSAVFNGGGLESLKKIPRPMSSKP